MSNVRTQASDDALLALITSCLALWARAGTVRREACGAIVIESGGHAILVARAAADVPFRWSITIDGRERVASSVNGLLRILRASLDPEFRPSRVRIAPLEIVPP